MAGGCQFSAVAAVTMIGLVLAAAIATLTSVITAHQPITPGSNCQRTCGDGDDHRVCHFRFDVHPYQTMSRACYGCPNNSTDCQRPECLPGDGISRRIIVVNKQLPGPPIQVCKGDTVVVDVKNSLHDAGLTIHWHGITLESDDHCSNTPHMDGVPGITQCPINAKSSFRYSFVANTVGTHFYHAHTGFHRGDGVFGSVIVREVARQDPNHGLFDYDLSEHVILFHDWLHMPTEDKFNLRHFSGGDDFPESMLINGRGPWQHANKSSPAARVPYSRFTVTPGNRYRLRLINAGILNCPITVSIEEHILTVIATDGNPIVPINATSLVVYPGERWDVVISTKNKMSGTYWMSFMGGVDCAESAAHQFALLQYQEIVQRDMGYNGRPGVRSQVPKRRVELEDSVLVQQMSPKPKFTEIPPSGVQVNSINSACYEDLVCMGDLRSPHAMPEELSTPRASYTFYLAFEMRRINNAHYYSRIYYDFNLMNEEQQIPTPQINNLTSVHPTTPLLLGVDASTKQRICNTENLPTGLSCHSDHCECLHMYEIPLGASVDLVLIDEGQYGDENHPVHLHGHHFWVLGQDRPVDLVDAHITRAQVIDMDKRGKLVRNLDHPIRKDTVTIPDAGYTVVRFHANNPGYWLLHCHLLFHSVIGMDVIFKVGDETHIPPPPPGFPTCGNYKGVEL